MSAIPFSSTPIQIEAARFKSAVSEGLIQKMGGTINFLLASIAPVGSIMDSILSEADFQEQSSDAWILADGRSISGSNLELLTGYTTAPDLRGVFRRGRNYTRDGSTGNPAGDMAIGTYQVDGTGIHNHGVTNVGHSHQIPNKGIAKDNDFTGYLHTGDPGAAGPTGSNTFSSSAAGVTVNNSAGPESCPRNVTVNVFIKIN